MDILGGLAFLFFQKNYGNRFCYDIENQKNFLKGTSGKFFNSFFSNDMIVDIIPNLDLKFFL